MNGTAQQGATTSPSPRTPLTELGLPRLWHEDPERLWPFMRWWMPAAMRVLAPNAGYGVERTGVEGGAVIAVNHFSAIDPPLVGCYSRRAVYYLTKSELLAIPVVGEILRWTGAFAIARGRADRDALRVARWLVGHGHVVGVFVEGTRQETGRPGPAQPGAAMIALSEGVPVIPCGIETSGWTWRQRRACAVVWGNPMPLDDLPRTGAGIKQATNRIQDEIHRLWRLAEGAVAAGLPAVLADGTRRGSSVRPWQGLSAAGAPSWPIDDWAATSLGPLYRGERRLSAEAAERRPRQVDEIRLRERQT